MWYFKINCTSRDDTREGEVQGGEWTGSGGRGGVIMAERRYSTFSKQNKTREGGEKAGVELKPLKIVK